MFQDEARFGRMVRIRRCWSPAPQRPVVDNGYERQFQYVYGAVSPLEGELDWMIRPVMNTEQMGQFLAQVSAAHVQDVCTACRDIRRNSIPRNMCGMRFGRRNFRIGCFPTWLESSGL